MSKLAVSILDADFLHLERELKAVTEAGADAIHLDVMDGHFVANLSFGVPVGAAVKRATPLPIHTHLMVAEPEKFIDWFLPFSDLVIFHVEATANPGRCRDRIHTAGKAAGVSLNPDTPLAELEPVIAGIQDVLLMSVFPGRGGQQFLSESLDRIRETRRLIDRAGTEATVSVDGGIKPDNCQAAVRAGADVLIAGSAVFRSKDYAAAIAALKCP